MNIEDHIKKAYADSAEGNRKGDTQLEVEGIRDYIRKAESIVVPNWNDKKITAINETLELYRLNNAVHLQFHTNCCDLSRTPAITKAYMALDISDCDLVIARGRLGVPGSGSMLILVDKKGRILSAALSPPHVIHQKSVHDAVRDELSAALERVGFVREKYE